MYIFSKMYARWVPRTNLLLVAITQNSESNGGCYDDSECPIASPPEFQFGFTEIFNASDKQQVNFVTYRKTFNKAPGRSIVSDEVEGGA